MSGTEVTDADTLLLASGGGRRRQVQRRALVLADQAVSSASNILVAILVARQVESAESFGAFSLAMIGYQIALSAARALVGEPLLSLYSSEPAARRRALVPDLLGATAFLGLAASGLLWAVSVVLGGPSGGALLALAAVLPLLLVQDMWRYLFVVDRPAAALAIDLVWLAVVAAAMPLAPDDASIAWFVLAWGLGGIVGAVLGGLLGPRWDGRPHPWRWLTDHRNVAVRFLGESTTGQALGHVLMVGLGAIAGLGALGAVRAAQVFLGPLNTLHSGIYLAVVPEGAALRDQPARMQRRLVKVSVALAAFVAAWITLGLLLPARWGRVLLGATWDDADGLLLLLLGVAALASGVQSGGVLGLRSLADARRSLRTRMRLTPILIACPLVGAVIWDAEGFALGTALATAIGAGCWWASFRSALREVDSRVEDR